MKDLGSTISYKLCSLLIYVGIRSRRIFVWFDGEEALLILLTPVA